MSMVDNTSDTGDTQLGDDLTGRVIIVTGGGRGLGRAFALDLAARGAHVVVNNRNRVVDDQGRGPADHVVAEIEAAGGSAVADTSDASDPSSGAHMVDVALERFGRLDGLVTSAAVTYEKSLRKSDVERIASLIDINVMGTFYAVMAAVPVLYEQGSGNIVILGSTGGLHGGHGLSAYAASKAANILLARSLAAESVGRGVHTNAVLPYAVTQMTDGDIPDKIRAVMQPEQVAPIVAALLSPSNRTNGEIIVAAGGGVRAAYMVEGDTVAVDRPSSAELAAALAFSKESKVNVPLHAVDAFQGFIADLLDR